MLNFSDHKIKKCPDSIYYIPNFICEEEEKNLLKNIYDAPKPKWTQLKNRRLQNWGGIPQSKGMIAEEMPNWLNEYCVKLQDLNIFESLPNHCLINEYKPGQGIMPHEDGTLYYPTVSTISLGSHILLDFYKPISETESNKNFDSNKITLEERFMFSLCLEPRSLVILKDDMYKVYLHGIKEVEKDEINPNIIANYDQIEKNNNTSESFYLNRETRVSITIRVVPKTLKLNVNSLLSKNFKK